MTTNGESVSTWVGGLDCGDEDELYEDVGYAVPASEFGEVEDDASVLGRLNASDEEHEENYDGSVAECLAEVAASVQRLIVNSLKRVHIRGRVHLDFVNGERQRVRHKFFSVPGYTVLTDLQDSRLYDMIRGGRVVTRVGGATGIGKTTKLPALIAKNCNKRVCLVTLNASLARAAMQVQSSVIGVPGSHRTWIREQRPYLVAMSYADFRGVVCSGGRTRFFADNDVFIFDEPQVKTAQVWLAKQYFATYATDRNSLLLLSATVSTSAENNVSAQGVGSFIEEPVSGGFDSLLASGKLISQFCQDRTMVVVPCDRAVYSVRSYYYAEGLDVRELDSGSTDADEKEVRAWLQPAESSCPRILVVPEEYGTATNFPVSYVITSATKMVYVVGDDGSLTEQVVPLEAEEVLQHKGRTGRGMATGSGGVVASKALGKVPGDLMKCEELEALLGLYAADIEPRPQILLNARRLVPAGVPRSTACELMNIHLNKALLLHYLGSDGKVAGRFAKAITLYLQPDCSLEVSKDYDPVGYRDWISEGVGGYYEGDESHSSSTLTVPFSSPPSLKVVMHTLSAVARGLIEVPRWRPAHGDDSDSESDDLGVRSRVKPKVRVAKLRVVRDAAVAPPRVLETGGGEGFSYQLTAEREERQRRRRAMSWVKTDVGAAVVKDLSDRAARRVSLDTVVSDVVRTAEGSVTMVNLNRSDSMVPVHSPGGSLKFSVAEPLYEKLAGGLALTPGFFLDLMGVVKSLKTEFVKSSLFDAWAPPWLSVLRSVADEASVSHVIRHGFGPIMVTMVTRMYERYRLEAIKVCVDSNVYRKKVRKIWSSGEISVRKLARAIGKGALPVAQSDRFLRRLHEIYVAYEDAIRMLEEKGFYNPALVTAMQQPLPVRPGTSKTDVVGGEVVPHGLREF